MNEETTRFLFWDFLAPERLWALILVLLLVVAYIALLGLRRNRGIRYTQTAIVGAVLPRQSQWRRHLIVLTALLALAAVIFAWARPAGKEKVPRERATVALVLDSSISMQATDISPNRFDASKNAAINFLDGLPAKYNLSVIKLAGQPNTLIPASKDRGAARRAIELMEPAEGTNIGKALDQAISTIQSAPGESEAHVPGMIVLLSDGGDGGAVPGESMSPGTRTALEKAKELEIPVYTIAYGTMNGFVDVDGERFNVAPDTELMSQIASQTGGETIGAKSPEKLKEAYEKMNSAISYEEVNKEITARWAFYALLFATIACIGGIRIAARG